MSDQPLMYGPAQVKMPKRVVHGAYVARTATCQAPGCGKEFETRAAFRGARYCSNRCRVQFGSWSFRANRGGPSR